MSYTPLVTCTCTFRVLDDNDEGVWDLDTTSRDITASRERRQNNGFSLRVACPPQRCYHGNKITIRYTFNTVSNVLYGQLTSYFDSDLS